LKERSVSTPKNRGLADLQIKYYYYYFSAIFDQTFSLFPDYNIVACDDFDETFLKSFTIS